MLTHLVAAVHWLSAVLSPRTLEGLHLWLQGLRGGRLVTPPAPSRRRAADGGNGPIQRDDAHTPRARGPPGQATRRHLL